MALIDISGNRIGTDSRGALWYDASNEEARHDWGAYTCQELIDNVYEPLRLANPNYITRSNIGKDASGLYDIWTYTFDPGYTEQTIYLQAGIHPYEEDAWIALARMMQIICNDWQSHAGVSYLRWNCKIIVLPVYNVWGVSQPRGSRTSLNYNGLNLNRDAVTRNDPDSQTIGVWIDGLLETEKISFALDFHTTVNNSYGDYMFMVSTGNKNELVGKNMAYSLAVKNAPERTSAYLEKYSLGEHDLKLNYFGNSTNSGTCEKFWFGKGIASATCEHSDYVWDTTESTAKCIQKAVECFMNQTLAHARAKFVTYEIDDTSKPVN